MREHSAVADAACPPGENMIAFNYVEPANLAEALAALARYGDEARPIAGGTG